MLPIVAAAMVLAGSAQQASATPAASGMQAPAGVDVELMVLREVTGDRAKPGDEVKMQVNQPVRLGEGVIPAGTPAFGEVMDAKASSAVLSRGKVAIRLVRLVVNGRDVPVIGELASRGRGGKNDDLVKALIVPWYALIARGNAGKFKAGELVHGQLPAGFRLP